MTTVSEPGSSSVKRSSSRDIGMRVEPSMRASSYSHGSRTSSSTGRSPASSQPFRARGVMFSWSEVSMSLELVVGDDAACRSGVEFLDYGQVRWMLHVFLKTGSVLEPGEKSVGISSGAPRDVFTHGEINRARHLISQSTDRRDEIFDLFFRGLFPNGEKHEMVYHRSPLG